MLLCKAPYVTSSGVSVPCGKCFHCKTRRAREWTVRLMLHRLSYRNRGSSFLTLTYRQECYPFWGSLRPDDLTKYWKRLRKSGLEFSYYACGEYGERFGRPHYHAILFGLDQSYRDLLQEHWPFGNIHLGNCTAASIAYTAQYIDKKIFGDIADAHYGVRHPEFQRSSKHLGFNYLHENAFSIAGNGVMLGNSRYPVPRYFIKYLQRVFGDDYQVVRDERAFLAESDYSLELWPEFDGARLSEIEKRVDASDPRLPSTVMRAQRTQRNLNLRARKNISNARKKL